jgi:predicted enzyme related to lactoylglutathione lyase
MAATSEFVRGVDFVSVPTRDMPALAAFYGETLGLPRSAYLPERDYAEFETGKPDPEHLQPRGDGVRAPL